jgi:hypothetical protein
MRLLSLWLRKAVFGCERLFWLRKAVFGGEKLSLVLKIFRHITLNANKLPYIVEDQQKAFHYTVEGLSVKQMEL